LRLRFALLSGTGVGRGDALRARDAYPADVPAPRSGARLGEQPDDHKADRVGDHGVRLRGPDGHGRRRAQRKPWARWFTIIATSSLIPIEVYEIVRELHPIRVFVLLANVAIVIYLVRRKELFETS